MKAVWTIAGAEDILSRNRPHCRLCVPHLAHHQLLQPGSLRQQSSSPQRVIHELPHSGAKQGQAVHAERPLLYCTVSSLPSCLCQTSACTEIAVLEG